MSSVDGQARLSDRHIGQVSTTKQNKSEWQELTAAHTVVWWLQNPDKPFEALTTAILF